MQRLGVTGCLSVYRYSKQINTNYTSAYISVYHVKPLRSKGFKELVNR